MHIPMRETEQRILAFHFQNLANKIQEILAETNSMGGKYPPVAQEAMYLALGEGLAQAEANARGLEDYVLHATDENWRVAPSSVKDHPPQP